MTDNSTSSTNENQSTDREKRIEDMLGDEETIGPAEEGAFLGEPCRMVYSLFYVKLCLSMSWTTQNHLLDLHQHWGI